jgi:hypothetical protein
MPFGFRDLNPKNGLTHPTTDTNSRHKKTDILSVYCYLRSGTSGLRRGFLEHCSSRLNNSPRTANLGAYHHGEN